MLSLHLVYNSTYITKFSPNKFAKYKLAKKGKYLDMNSVFIFEFQLYISIAIDTRRGIIQKFTSIGLYTIDLSDFVGVRAKKLMNMNDMNIITYSHTVASCHWALITKQCPQDYGTNCIISCSDWVIDTI